MNTGVVLSRFIKHRTFFSLSFKDVFKDKRNLKQTIKDKKSRWQVIGRFEIIPVLSSKDPRTAWCKQYLQILQSSKRTRAQVGWLFIF